MSPHAAVAKLEASGAGEAAVATFAEQVARVVAGERGMLAEADLEPVASLPDADDLPPVDPERAAELLRGAVVLKLNGGLGTSMGLAGPKSLLEVRPGTTFLDLLAAQVLHLREQTGARLPLVLMDSERTRPGSLERLAAAGIDDDGQDVPRDFLQGKVPKLRADDLEPADWPDDPALEWAPPGHGDLYPSLVGSGMLAALREAGYRHVFVSNVDNLGATLDPALLAWFADSGAPFAMEVADRTPADRKGGHLARRRDGSGLVLRELAQTPDEDSGHFQDVERHRYFNTNNLWLDLDALDAALREADGALALPLILNRKTVDPRDKGSTAVLQLETAMGAAIDVWEGAEAIRVPRRRMAPVKTTDDLLALRSDAYVRTEDSRLELAPERGGRPPEVRLDGDHYKVVDDFEARFAAGAPSLVGCDGLEVVGDVAFGADVVVRGRVRVGQEGEGQRRIADGTVLEG